MADTKKTTKKTAAKKVTVKKTPVKKVTETKSTSKTTAKKPAVKKAVTPKAAAKRTPIKKAAAKKPAAKKAAPKKSAAKATTKVAATEKALKSTASKQALHYDKVALLQEYTGTFDTMMKATVISIGAVLLYFFIMVTFLGGFSHEKTNSFAEKFGDRIDLGSSYDGQKLPMYEVEE